MKVWDARTAAAGAFDPWAEDARRRALGPTWHAEDAASAEKAGDTFAAAFHRRWLAEHPPGPSVAPGP